MRTRLLLVAAVCLSSFGLGGRAACADDPKPAGTPPATPAAPPAAPAPAARGYVGFSSAPAAALPEEARTQLKITATKGVVVTSVVAGGPAAIAGLHVGDSILKYAGQEIPQANDAGPQAVGEAFMQVAATVKVGQEVEIVVERDGKPVTVKAVAVEQSVVQGAQVREAFGPLGLVAAPAALLSPKARKKLKVKAETGVVAVRVLAGGPAAKAGVLDGDVILKYAGKDVPDTKGFDPKNSDATQKLMGAIHDLVMDAKAGAEVEVVVEREGKPVALKAVAADGAALLKLAAAAGEDEEGDEGDEGDEGNEGPEKK